MKLGEFYKKGIDAGIKNDPRGLSAVTSDLEEVRRDYSKLSESEKEYFDKDELWNPYPDSELLYGDPEKEIKNIIVGIDIFSAELKAAHELGVDLALTHHPAGKAQAGIYKVSKMQVDIYKKNGVDVEAHDKLSRAQSVKFAYELYMREIQEADKGDNTEQMVDIARFYKIPFISFHTAADNCVDTFLQQLVNKNKPKNIQDVVDLLLEVPEYQTGAKEKIGPRIVTGERDSPAGRILVDMTGGYESPPEILTSLSRVVDIKTILLMHVSRAWYEVAEQHHINIVCAGHSPSDTLGLNILLDHVLENEDIKINDISGYRRFDRRSK